MLGVLDHPFFKSKVEVCLVVGGADVCLVKVDVCLVKSKVDVDLHKLLVVEPAPFDFMLVDAGEEQRVEGHLAALLHEAVETPEYAASLKDKVLKDEEFAYNLSGDTTHRRKAIDHACPECKQAMQAALHFLERFQVHRSLHVSATAVVLEATDLVPEEATIKTPRGISTRVALKGMRELNQVLAELDGREEIDSQCSCFFEPSTMTLTPNTKRFT